MKPNAAKREVTIHEIQQGPGKLNRLAEVGLSTYEHRQNAHQLGHMALSWVMHGMSRRNYEQAAIHMSETFGI
ncbi:MAG TPA: hypothetical protein VNJ08_03065 [Bacteriovoracaceae bacterium]|nr:hypothetical protein [Bacteriovoracaceae bacterium]